MSNKLNAFGWLVSALIMSIVGVDVAIKCYLIFVNVGMCDPVLVYGLCSALCIIHALESIGNFFVAYGEKNEG